MFSVLMVFGLSVTFAFPLSSHHFLSDTAPSYTYCTLRAPSNSSYLSPARSGPSPALSPCSSISQLITLAHIFSLRSISSENFSLNLSSWILLKSQCNMSSCPHHLPFQSSSCLYFLPREYTIFPSYFVLKLQKNLGFFIVPHFQLILLFFVILYIQPVFSIGGYNIISLSPMFPCHSSDISVPKILLSLLLFCLGPLNYFTLLIS